MSDSPIHHQIHTLSHSLFITVQSFKCQIPIHPFLISIHLAQTYSLFNHSNVRFTQSSSNPHTLLSFSLFILSLFIIIIHHNPFQSTHSSSSSILLKLTFCSIIQMSDSHPLPPSLNSIT
eukprot:TRINITY_DN2806_c0_g1_i5.p3 TRINITY_DN2806_c0_g1~~TRINITY_DN2806_c0_g1_i5.p3  ORF type:complete len:120 (-),score=20.51 TRINITY_DN2806_c0_g1_i5:45-404(-)